jgi:L-amino acid N-acyltransferase YncA
MYTSGLMRLEPPCAAHSPHAQPHLLGIDGFPIVTTHNRPLCVRPVARADTALLLDLISSLSDQAHRQRFSRPLRDVELIAREAARVMQREPHLGAAFVATTRERGHVRAVALAELAHDPAAPTTAELAIVVRDDYQHAGVGTQLLRQLIALAPRRGVRTLRATIQADNHAARHLLRNLGLAYRSRLSQGELIVWAELP